jgi:hypothetical protein
VGSQEVASLLTRQFRIMKIATIPNTLSASNPRGITNTGTKSPNNLTRGETIPKLF